MLAIPTTFALPQSVIVGASPLNYIATVGHVIESLIPNPAAIVHAATSVIPSPQEFDQSIKSLISAGLPIGTPVGITPVVMPGEVVVPGDVVVPAAVE